VTWVFVFGGLAMHLAVFATMGIAFFQTMLLYVVFLEAVRRYPPCGRRAGFARGYAERLRLAASRPRLAPRH
jgi:hypothetical protein